VRPGLQQALLLQLLHLTSLAVAPPQLLLPVHADLLQVRPLLLLVVPSLVARPVVHDLWWQGLAVLPCCLS
jgi:hypothetical protein